MNFESMEPHSKLLYLGNPSPINSIPEDYPLYSSTAYIMEDLDDYEEANKGNKYSYSRSTNPNRDQLAEAMTWLEQGEDSLILASGMGAISTTLLSFSEPGKTIIINKASYGETISLADKLLKKFRVNVVYTDFNDLTHLESLMTTDVLLLYTEVITNPLIQVVDIPSIASIAHKYDAYLAIDSTFTTPVLFQPLKHGADIVIHSLTKFIGGHSDLSGGSITSSRPLIRKMRETHLLLGTPIDAASSHLFLRSIRTLDLRVKKQIENASLLAAHLSNDPRILEVNHPSLSSHPQHALAQKLFSDPMFPFQNTGYGPMLSFRIQDDRELVNHFIRELSMIRYLGTLGGFRTSLAHPATAFRNDFSPEELIAMGLFEGLIRISCGIEEPMDIIKDISQALDFAYQKTDL